MGIFEFLMNQQFSYYGRLISFFLIITIIAFLVIVLKFRMENKKSIIISSIISLVLVLAIIWASHIVYNEYDKNYVKKTSAKSELGEVFLEISPMKKVDESIMNFLKVNYNKIK